MHVASIWLVVIIAHLSFVGAEWWAQDFQKSMPLLGWVPFIPGNRCYHAYIVYIIQWSSSSLIFEPSISPFLMFFPF
jgi:hypothetical protein